MKLSKRFLHLGLAALALAGLVISRALWLAPVTMLWSSTARADNPIWSPYQQSLANNSCGNGQCAVTFPAVDKETLVLQVTCYLTVSNSGIFTAQLVNGQGAFNMLPVFTYEASGGTTYYAILSPTYLFLSSGQAPTVQVYNDSGALNVLGCDVAGYGRSGPSPLADAAPPPAAGPLPASPGSLPPFSSRLPGQ
jgi:hypothetical protein